MQYCWLLISAQNIIKDIAYKYILNVDITAYYILFMITVLQIKWKLNGFKLNRLVLKILKSIFLYILMLQLTFCSFPNAVLMFEWRTTR